MMKYLSGGLGVFGLLLVFLSFPAWNPYRVQPEDESAAFARLAAVPLTQIEARGEVDLIVSSPTSTSWKRIRHSWGDPDYIIAAVSPGIRKYIYCFGQLGLTVQATVGTEPLKLAMAEFPPYGYNNPPDAFFANCRWAGLTFRMSPGATARIHIATGRDRFNRDAELVIEPYWAGMKDRLVGAALDKELGGAMRLLGAAGAVMILLAGLTLARQQSRRIRSAI